MPLLNRPLMDDRSPKTPTRGVKAKKGVVKVEPEVYVVVGSTLVDLKVTPVSPGQDF